MLVGFWWENQKEKENYKDPDLDVRVILKWILEK
jgi:hypothetical protein